MDIGVFIPINNNGWIISATSPQYMPSFELNKQVVLKAEAYGLDFALSMIKLHGFGGKTEFWDHGLESFTLMAGLAAVTQPDHALRLDGGTDDPAGDRRPYGLDDLGHLRRPLRSQHRLGMAQDRIQPDGAVAGRRTISANATTIAPNMCA